MALGRKFEVSHPEIVASVMSSEKFVLPRSWKVDTKWFSEEYEAATFVSLYFTVPLKLDRASKQLPWYMGYLLAGHLQLGEGINFRNFQNYRSGRVKYLPMVLLEDGIRFYVYDPTAARVGKSIETFQRILETIDPLLPALSNVLQDAYALVRLSEVEAASTLILPAKQEISTRLADVLSPYRSKLGFVYQGMEGCQDANCFHYDIYEADRK